MTVQLALLASLGAPACGGSAAPRSPSPPERVVVDDHPQRDLKGPPLPIKTSLSGDFHGRNHRGIDLKTPWGTEVLAVLDGTVLEVRRGGQRKACAHSCDYVEVVVQDAAHARRRVVYGELIHTALRPGDEVMRGEIVGLSTERLHLSVRRGKKWVDPLIEGDWIPGARPVASFATKADVALSPCGRVDAMRVARAPWKDEIVVDLRDCHLWSPPVELFPNDRSWSARPPKGERTVLRATDVEWHAGRISEGRAGLWPTRKDCLHVLVNGVEQHAIPMRGGACAPHPRSPRGERAFQDLPVPVTVLREPVELLPRRDQGPTTVLGPVAGPACFGSLAAQLREELSRYPPSLLTRVIDRIELVGRITFTWPDGTAEPLRGLYRSRVIRLDAQGRVPWLIHHELAHALAAHGHLPRDPWPDLLDGVDYTWGLFRRGPVDRNALGGRNPRSVGFRSLYATSAAAEDLAEMAASVMTERPLAPRWGGTLRAKVDRLEGWYRDLGITLEPGTSAAEGG